MVFGGAQSKSLFPAPGKFDGTICGDDRYTPAVFDACAPRLKVVSKWGTGIDSIDKPYADAMSPPVMVGNSPGAFTQPVSDSVIAYIMQFCRQQVWMDQHMKLGRWHKINGRALEECTVGVIGVGAIGQEVMRKLAPWGCKLIGYDIVEPSAEFIADTGCRMVPVEELLANSDFVTINCQLTAETDHFMNEERFALMRDSAYLINTARGPSVKESALIEALQAGSIAGAAMDVFEFEPLQVGFAKHNAAIMLHPTPIVLNRDDNRTLLLRWTRRCVAWTTCFSRRTTRTPPRQRMKTCSGIPCGTSCRASASPMRTMRHRCEMAVARLWFSGYRDKAVIQ